MKPTGAVAINRRCGDCDCWFRLTPDEQRAYASMKLPRTCKSCRALRRQVRSQAVAKG